MDQAEILEDHKEQAYKTEQLTGTGADGPNSPGTMEQEVRSSSSVLGNFFFIDDVERNWLYAIRRGHWQRC